MNALRSLRRSPTFALTVIAALGIGIGAALSFGLTRVRVSVVGKLPSFDAPSYAFASLAVLVIVLRAISVPARAAANVDPMTVLSSE
jgi:ABC-type antimicrobial peptide transport system permease subunit